MIMNIAEEIQKGNTSLGIEFGSTRIKAVLILDHSEPIASGSFDWENHFENGVWTYPLEEVWKGIRVCFSGLMKDVNDRYGIAKWNPGAIGISAMMHGYLVFDDQDELLTPFRTWRNTITGEAAEKLTALFDYQIPQRWSIAHLYQAVLNKEEHVDRIRFITTLAGYVHWKLTGQKVVGIGEASGMFPIDSVKKCYREDFLDKWNTLSEMDSFSWKLNQILPTVQNAGEKGGYLTAEGASLLDPSGMLKEGIVCCPPEGDAGTGMVATNSVAVRTGNISAGTSAFTMVVLEHELSRVYEQIDLVTTPDGEPVAMVHCNNCTSDLNAWISLLEDSLACFGCKPDKNTLYSTLFQKALEGAPDCGGLVSYNYISGEPVMGLSDGVPLVLRGKENQFTIANFMRMHLYSALAALKSGMDLLTVREGVKIDRMFAHGGLYKTPEVGQKITAAALNLPVSVMETAGEGGAWGIAILASYTKNKESDETLKDYLNQKVFVGQNGSNILPYPEDVKGFDEFMNRYRNAIEVEKAAICAGQK